MLFILTRPHHRNHPGNRDGRTPRKVGLGNCGDPPAKNRSNWHEDCWNRVLEPFTSRTAKEAEEQSFDLGIPPSKADGRIRMGTA